MENQRRKIWSGGALAPEKPVRCQAAGGRLPSAARRPCTVVPNGGVGAPAPDRRKNLTVAAHVESA